MSHPGIPRIVARNAHRKEVHLAWEDGRTLIVAEAELVAKGLGGIPPPPVASPPEEQPCLIETSRPAR